MNDRRFLFWRYKNNSASPNSILQNIVSGFVIVLNKSTPLLLTLAVFITIMASLGHVARWDLLEQISMADNYIKYGYFYPDSGDLTPGGVSVYFPGTAFIAYFLQKIGIYSFLVEAMLVIACVVVFLFFYIQSIIARRMFSVGLKFSEWVVPAIIMSFILAPDWFSYAIEFKPDTIAFLLGFIGLLVAGLYNDESVSYFWVFIGALICGAALMFKQQYIAFLLGLVIYVLVFPSKKKIFFAITALFVALSIIYILFVSVDPWFWNVTVLSDDGFISLKEAIQSNWKTFTSLLYFLVIFFSINMGAAVMPKFSALNLTFSSKSIIRSPWLWVVAPSILTAVASSFKVGGNSGNTQLGIVLLAPLIFVLMKYVDRKIVLSFAWIAVFSALPMAYSGLKSYYTALQLKEYIETHAPNSSSLVLTGSNTYYATRQLNSQHKIVNYWSISIASKASVFESVPTILNDLKPDFIILENWPSNKAAIENSSHYQIDFENELGLVASLR